MKIIYHGHSFVQLENNNHSILIDPFISGNPTAKVKPEEIKCDYIILTHGHGDHISDAISLATNNNAEIISSFEIANYAEARKVKSFGLGIGGGFNFPFGRVKLTIAHHSSSFPDGTYAGNPAGVLITIDGKTIYHSGDTGLFYDMKLIGEINKIDVAFLPIGDYFTMGTDDAVKATEFINAGVTVPIHYNTFGIINANPEDFKRKVESIGKKCTILKIGESIEI
jgi:L-ascorbate metabolism protein UlaG (beta-lactamase superfamily)